MSAERGVAVWRVPGVFNEDGEATFTTKWRLQDEPGRWYREAYAAALVDVAEAARPRPFYEDRTESPDLDKLRAALDRLDAAKATP